jgi:hypothetical protein
MLLTLAPPPPSLIQLITYCRLQAAFRNNAHRRDASAKFEIGYSFLVLLSFLVTQSCGYDVKGLEILKEKTLDLPRESTK